VVLRIIKSIQTEASQHPNAYQRLRRTYAILAQLPLSTAHREALGSSSRWR